MRRLGLVLLAGVVVFAAAAAIAAIQVRTIPVRELARKTPHRTALMLEREAQARDKGRVLHIDQRWIGYRSISPTLRRAVLVAEDDTFFRHSGLDWHEIQASARANLRKGRVVRGGSTITQQLAKNIYLGDGRTITRKLKEAFLAIRLEDALSKQRIFELYLNLIEWGDGVFGCEAAARRYFGVSASALSTRQALLLAAVIINPRRFSVLAPGPRIERRVQIIASRMRRRGYLSEAEYLVATGKAPPPRSWFDWLFGGSPDTMSKAQPDSVAPAPTAPTDSSFAPDTAGVEGP